MRLIDADALANNITIVCKKNKESIDDWLRNYIEDEITDAPITDLVRCKDCKYNYANQIPSSDECQLCVELPISKDFYCAYGEKTDEVNDE